MLTEENAQRWRWGKRLTRRWLPTVPAHISLNVLFISRFTSCPVQSFSIIHISITVSSCSLFFLLSSSVSKAINFPCFGLVLCPIHLSLWFSKHALYFPLFLYHACPSKFLPLSLSFLSHHLTESDFFYDPLHFTDFPLMIPHKDKLLNRLPFCPVFYNCFIPSSSSVLMSCVPHLFIPLPASPCSPDSTAWS